MNNEINNSQCPECYRQKPKLSYVRIFHASPDAPPVDVYANGKLLASNLIYKNFTQYMPVPEGTYTINVFPAGRKTNPVINTQAAISKNSILSIAAGGKLQDIKLYFIPEVIEKQSPGKTYVRFAHLSPNAPSVDITLPDGKKLFTDVEFGEYTKYLEILPGNYALNVKPTGAGQTVLNIPKIVLKPNRFYTVYAVGLVGGAPPLQVVIPLDGISYLRQ